MSVENKVISIEYLLKDAKSGKELDSNVGGEPLEFISGKEQIIAGLEKEVINMNVGDKADVIVKPEDAYGEYNEEAVQTVAREQFAGLELVEGMSLYGSSETQETIQVIVKSFDDEKVTIDYNHPMAGKTLMFTLSVLNLRDATAEEVQMGFVGGMAAMNAAHAGCCGSGSCSSEEGHNHSHQEGTCCSTQNEASNTGSGCCSH